MVKAYRLSDWFRIRHYASTNEIKYQRKETVYGQNANFVFETASGSNYSYPVNFIGRIRTLTIGEL